MISKETVTLSGAGLTIESLSAIVAGAPVSIAPAALTRMAEARAVIDAALAARKPVYGVTTGLGPKATEALSEDELDAFALTTIRGRGHAAGRDAPAKACRAATAVRLNTLLIGAAGAKPALATLLAECLNAGLAPVIRSIGSIGAADLMQGGDFGLALIGEGRMYAGAAAKPSADALKAAGLSPYSPGPREGLALVSHSSVSAALAALATSGADAALTTAQRAAALSMEAFRANLSPLDADALAIRPQPGQEPVAAEIRRLLKGSALWRAGAARRLQDPLSIRNVAQIHGATYAAIEHARSAVEAEINGASDNPAVIADRADVLSHGGYLTPHLVVAMGGLALSLAQLAASQTARIGKLLYGRFTDLPTGLTPVGAGGAGLVPVMKTAEALWAAISHAAAPAPVYPSFSADGLEDVIAHSGLAAKSVLEMLEHMKRLSAIEHIVGTQALALRGLGDDVAPEIREIAARVREISALFEDDRPLGEDIERLAATL